MHGVADGQRQGALQGDGLQRQAEGNLAGRVGTRLLHAMVLRSAGTHALLHDRPCWKGLALTLPSMLLMGLVK